MKVFLLLIMVGVALGGDMTPLPAGTVAATQAQVVDTITEIMNSENQANTDAEAMFTPINDTCAGKYATAIDNCKACKDTKCQTRTRSVCTAEEQQSVGGPVLGIESAPFLVTQVLPNVVAGAIGGPVRGAVDTVENVVTNQIPNTVVNVAGGAVNGAVNLGKKGGNFASNLAGEAANTGNNAINSVVDVLESGLDAGEDVIDTVKGWFGGKRDLAYEKRTAEPTCADLKSNYTTACQFYATATHCPSCIFDIDTECPDYTSAEERYEAALATTSYRSKMIDTSVNIKTISFDQTTYDPPTGGFRVVVVEAAIFGVDLPLFHVGEPVNPWTPATSAPIIGRVALEKFKSS